MRAEKSGARRTTLGKLPRVRVAWHPLRQEQAIPPAPLVYSLISFDGWRRLATLASYAFTRHTRRHFDDDIRLQLMHRLNAFAQLEINLWWFAADGGHPDPPPYAVRYDLAGWLWNPAIPGAIFCLRCGDGLWYERRE